MAAGTGSKGMRYPSAGTPEDMMLLTAAVGGELHETGLLVNWPECPWSFRDLGVPRLKMTLVWTGQELASVV
jgi:hypothetical protein